MPGKAFWVRDAKDFEAPIKPLASVQVMAFPSLQLLAEEFSSKERKGKWKGEEGQLPVSSLCRGGQRLSTDGPGASTKHSGRILRRGLKGREADSAKSLQLQ